MSERILDRIQADPEFARLSPRGKRLFLRDYLNRDSDYRALSKEGQAQFANEIYQRYPDTTAKSAPPSSDAGKTLSFEAAPDVMETAAKRLKPSTPAKKQQDVLKLTPPKTQVQELSEKATKAKPKSSEYFYPPAKKATISAKVEKPPNALEKGLAKVSEVLSVPSGVAKAAALPLEVKGREALAKAGFGEGRSKADIEAQKQTADMPFWKRVQVLKQQDIRTMGMTPETQMRQQARDRTGKPAEQMIGGVGQFLGDLAIDPLTWFMGGGNAVVKKATEIATKKAGAKVAGKVATAGQAVNKAAGAAFTGQQLATGLPALKQGIEEGDPRAIMEGLLATTMGLAGAAHTGGVPERVGAGLEKRATKRATAERMAKVGRVQVKPTATPESSSPPTPAPPTSPQQSFGPTHQIVTRGEQVPVRVVADNGVQPLLMVERDNGQQIMVGRGQLTPMPEQTKPATAPVQQEAPPVTPETSEASARIAEVDPRSLTIDPERFQYKQNTGQKGTTGKLRSVEKYDPDLGGVLLVWKDPADGKDYVVNGHHRDELALRTGAPSVLVRYIDAPDAATARTKGALVNIAEGQGTALDAAKVFREKNFTPQELAQYGVSSTGKIANEGLALAALDDFLFRQVANGAIPESRGIAIGRAEPDPVRQRALFQIIEGYEKRGSKLSDNRIEDLAHEARTAPIFTQNADNLFGEEGVFSQSLAVEKAKLAGDVREEFAKDKALFGRLSNEKRAQELERGQNQINVEENARIAGESAQLAERFDRARRLNIQSIDAALNEAALALAHGEKPANVKQKLFARIRHELQSLPDTEPGGTGGLLPGRDADPSGNPDLFSEPQAPAQAPAPEVRSAPAAETAPAEGQVTPRTLPPLANPPPTPVPAPKPAPIAEATPAPPAATPETQIPSARVSAPVPPQKEAASDFSRARMRDIEAAAEEHGFSVPDRAEYRESIADVKKRAMAQYDDIAASLEHYDPDRNALLTDEEKIVAHARVNELSRKLQNAKGAERDALLAEIARVSNILHRAASASGRSLRIQADLVADPTNPAAVMQQLDMMTDGKATPFARSSLLHLAEQAQEAKAQADASLEKRAAGAESEAGKSLRTRTNKAAKDVPRFKTSEWGSQNEGVTREQAEAARKALVKTFSKAGAFPDFAEALPHLVTLAKFHYEAGARKFGEWREAMLADSGGHLDEGEMETVWAQMRADRQANQETRTLPAPESFTDRLAGKIGREGSVNFLEAIADEEGNPALLNKMLKGETLTPAERATVQTAWEANAPSRKTVTGTKPAPDTALSDILKETARERAKKRPPTVASVEKRAAQTRTTAEKRLGTLGEKRAPAPKPTLPEILVAAQEYAKGARTLDAFAKRMREKHGNIDNAFLQQLFSEAAGQYRKDYKAVADIKASINRTIEAEAYRVAPAWKKGLIRTGQVADVPRSLLTSFDYSGLLRQGGTLAFSDPKSAAMAAKQMFGAGWSEEYAATIDHHLRNIRANGANGNYARAGLELTDLSSKHEEGFGSPLAESIPLIGRGVKASERAYSTVLNQLRADAFDRMVQPGMSDAQMKDIARYINVASGRGDIQSPKAQQVVGAAANVLFSPRYLVSRFQYLSGQPLWSASDKASRKIIAREYARYLRGVGTFIGVGAAMMAANGQQMEIDPRSSDFLKIRIGNTEIDALSGLQQALTYSARMLTQKTKTQEGDILNLRAPESELSPNTKSVNERFVRSKLGPVPGMLWNLAEAKKEAPLGTDYLGKPQTGVGILAGMTLPFVAQDIVEAWMEDGMSAKEAKNLAVSLGLSTIGLGANVRDREQEARKKAEENPRAQMNAERAKLRRQMKQ
jgi:hypothetical protein